MKATLPWTDPNPSPLTLALPRSSCMMLTNYTVRYQIWGEGTPLILVPALAGGIPLITPLALCLAHHGFRVISYELRGEDDCFALRRRFSVQDLVDDLGEFVDHMGLEKPLLMGVSFGSALAMMLAAQRPHRLQGVVAQGINVRFERSLLRQVAGQVLSRYPLPPDSPFINQFFNLLFGGKQTDKLIFDFVTQTAWRTDQSVMSHRFKLAEQVELRPYLPKLKLPMLLMNGDRDLLVSSNGLDEISRSTPQAVVKILPQGGHLAFVTHAPMLAGYVRQFALDRIAAE
jgi:pimeloyl-ACP methyl ester carboxylesterase